MSKKGQMTMTAFQSFIQEPPLHNSRPNSYCAAVSLETGYKRVDIESLFVLRLVPQLLQIREHLRQLSAARCLF